MLVLGAAGVAGADYKETYGRGLESFKQQSWSDVARLMQQAIDENPQESKAIRIYGMTFEPYLPHYYLGVARAQLGSCEAALAAWRTSEAQGVIQKLREHGDLVARRAACLGPQVRAAEAEIQKARQSSQSVAALARDPVLSDMWSREGLAAKQTAATKSLSSAAAGLESAKDAGDVDGIQAAGRLAAQARQELDAIARRGEQRRGELQAALERELRSRRQAITALVAPAQEVLREADVPPLSVALGPERAALRQALDAAAEADSIRSPEALEDVRRRLDRASTDLRAAITAYGKTDGLRRELENLAAEAGEVLSEARQLPAGAGAQSQVSALQEALQGASNVEAVRSADELRERRRRLDTAMVSLRNLIDAYRAATPVRKRIEDLTQQATPLLDRANRLPPDAGLQDQVSALERALEAASGAGSVRSTSELETLLQGLKTAAGNLDRALDEHRRMSDIRQQISTRSRTAGDAVERARKLPREAGLGSRLSAAQEALAAAANAGSTRSVRELERLRQSLDDAATALERALDEYGRRPPPAPATPPAKPPAPALPADAGPPAALRQAVQAYLDGDFQGTLRILGAESFTDSRAQAQVHLFRAAAQHALFRMTGGENQDLLQAAAKEVRACRGLDAGLEPDRETFSPAFADFFRHGGA